MTARSKISPGQRQRPCAGALAAVPLAAAGLEIYVRAHRMKWSSRSLAVAVEHAEIAQHVTFVCQQSNHRGLTL